MDEKRLCLLLVEDNEVDRMAFERFVKREKLQRGVDYEIPLVPIDRHCSDGLHRLPCFFFSWTRTACAYAYAHCAGCRGGCGAAARSPAYSRLG